MKKHTIDYVDIDIKAELINKILINILIGLLCLCVVSIIVLLWLIFLTKGVI